MHNYFKRLIAKNREFILGQVLAVQGLMQLLMKSRNTGRPWTFEEKLKIKLHLFKLSLLIPALIVFLLPFGSLMLPLLAEVLDRRKSVRPREAGAALPARTLVAETGEEGARRQLQPPG